MKTLATLVSMSFFLFGGTAYAETNITPLQKDTACKTTSKKKKRRWRPRKKVVKQCPKPAAPQVFIMQACACRGTRGPIGPRGRSGGPGETIYRGPDISLGYMGMALWPKNAYAWSQGPSIRLTSPLSAQKDLAIELGWGVGRDRAVMGQVTVTHWLKKRSWLGLGGGLFGQVIGLRANRDTGYYGGITPQISARTGWRRFGLQAQVGPTFGLAGYDGSDTDVVAGFLSSANLSYKW